jgi:hypothetical protein
MGYADTLGPPGKRPWVAVPCLLATLVLVVGAPQAYAQ